MILLQPQLFHFIGQGGISFALARECAHHELGHVVISQPILQTNPFVMPWMTPRIELEAACEAGTFLASVGDLQAIQTGMQFVGSSGPSPTGPNYPSGIQRVRAIQVGSQQGRC